MQHHRLIVMSVALALAACGAEAEVDGSGNAAGDEPRAASTRVPEEPRSEEGIVAVGHRDAPELANGKKVRLDLPFRPGVPGVEGSNGSGTGGGTAGGGGTGSPDGGNGSTDAGAGSTDGGASSGDGGVGGGDKDAEDCPCVLCE